MAKDRKSPEVQNAAAAGLLIGAVLGGAAVLALANSNRNRKERRVQEVLDWTMEAARRQLADHGFVQLLLPWDADSVIADAFHRAASSLKADAALLHIRGVPRAEGRDGYRFYTRENHSRYLTDRLEMHFIHGGGFHEHREHAG